MRNLLLALMGCTFLSMELMANECVPSEWGPNDEIGAANRITPERTLAAAKLVKQGASHPLGIVITPGMPSYPPRYTQLQVVQPEQHFRTDTTPQFGWNATANDDLVQMWLGTGPQLDGLGHMGEAEFYNCNQGKTLVRGSYQNGHQPDPANGGPRCLDRYGAIFRRGPSGSSTAFFQVGYSSSDGSAGLTIGEGMLFCSTGWTDAKLNADPDNGCRRFPVSQRCGALSRRIQAAGGRCRYLGFGCCAAKAR